MAVFKIRGGKKLAGEITPQGAKNEALQIISATLLSSQAITIHNIPNIRDVNKLIELLGDLGSKVEKLGPESYRFTANQMRTGKQLTPGELKRIVLTRPGLETDPI